MPQPDFTENFSDMRNENGALFCMHVEGLPILRFIHKRICLRESRIKIVLLTSSQIEFLKVFSSEVKIQVVNERKMWVNERKMWVFSVIHFIRCRLLP